MNLKPIPGYEGRYSISECGAVYSHISDRQLKHSKAGAGYCIVFFYNKETQKNKGLYIHRLVAASFVKNPALKPEVNHIDGNKENNHFSNLEWATKKENSQHALRSGLRPCAGEYANISMGPKGFCDDDIRRMRALRSDGLTVKKISEIFEISSRHAGMIVNRKSYKNVL